MRKLCLSLLLAAFALTAPAQTLRGIVTEAVSGDPLPFATVQLRGNGVQRTVSTDSIGEFIFTDLAVQRYSVRASYIGYESLSATDLLVSPAKETVVSLPLQEILGGATGTSLGTATVQAKVRKEQPLNAMNLVGGKMISVEETSRYAGGFDDPARFINCFAGVSSTGAENGISIHGNAPHTLQWHIEGVEVPAPNHMSDCYALGSGLISALSSQVMGNSDFAYSAFPAEYGNAIGGLMDIRLRSGNNDREEASVGVGLLGLEAACEGPIDTKTGSSYVMNYRYSLLGLANSMGLIPSGDILNYQDFNFKVNVPTRHAGTFSLWGLAWKDHAYDKLGDADEWESLSDQENTDVRQETYLAGLTHRIGIGSRGSLKTTIAASYQSSDIYDEYALLETASNYNSTQYRVPCASAEKDLFDLTFSTVYQQNIGKSVLLKAGVNLIRHDYDLSMSQADFIVSTNTAESLRPVYSADYATFLAEAFAAANISLSRNWLFNVGAFSLWNTTNGKKAIDPRVSLRWDMGSAGALSLGYGLHSMMERMDALAVTIDGRNVNSGLDFMRSHQVQLSYAKKLGEHHNLKVDLYYQRHFNVAVGTGDDAAFSMLNIFDYYVDKQLVNEGKGRNYGIDLTLERFFANGYYYAFNASLFKSEYAGIDGRWHRTRFDRGYVLKALGGKEWFVGRTRRNVLSANIKLSYMGGLRHSPYDVAATLANPDRSVEYDESEPFSCQLRADFNIDLTVSYKRNCAESSHEVGLKWLNLTANGNYTGDVFNYKKCAIEPYRVSYTFPNLYYRLYF